MSNTIKRVLVTGGSGYIGSNICKIMAALNPGIHVISLTHETIQTQKQHDAFKAGFKNISFAQGDCLDPEDQGLVEAVSSSDAVIHTVGALLEGDSLFDYRQVINDLEGGKIFSRDPAVTFESIFNEIKKRQNSIPVAAYEKSHEGLNRDSCINVAKILAESGQGQKNFVFFSASDTIVPMLSKYCEMKREAEEYLLHDEVCSQKLRPVILRPGLVWSSTQRGWTLPLKMATDIGYCLNKNIISQQDFPMKGDVQKLFPQSGSINLTKVTDFAIQGALGNLPERDTSSFDDARAAIWTNEDMNMF